MGTAIDKRFGNRQRVGTRTPRAPRPSRLRACMPGRANTTSAHGQATAGTQGTTRNSAHMFVQFPMGGHRDRMKQVFAATRDRYELANIRPTMGQGGANVSDSFSAIGRTPRISWTSVVRMRSSTKRSRQRGGTRQRQDGSQMLSDACAK